MVIFLKVSSNDPLPASLNFSGVSSNNNFPFAIIAALVHTASTSSKICVEIIIVLSFEIFY